MNVGSDTTKLRIFYDGCELTILQQGSCEGVKAGFHATTLALAITMGLYNAAAWIRRRERHLAVNAILYTALFAWERVHVLHHLASLRECRKKTLAADRAA